MFTSPVAVIAVVCLSYIIVLGVYRLWLSPIASFPGPKLAALTGWYEFYYDVILNGSYFHQIEEMHRQFGEPLKSAAIPAGLEAPIWDHMTLRLKSM